MGASNEKKTCLNRHNNKTYDVMHIFIHMGGQFKSQLYEYSEQIYFIGYNNELTLYLMQFATAAKTSNSLARTHPCKFGIVSLSYDRVNNSTR